ncbi:O-antigen ligase family protein [Arenibacterium sp. LLYu02]|uniref:O-antigen ligase family protein n=1 Tax=Arenibacterium sp. LLYu02 TaxID=3404132 RepID=UPI003B20F801
MDFKTLKPSQVVTETPKEEGTNAGSGSLAFEVTYVKERKTSSRRPSRLNSLTLAFLGLVVVLAPLPFESHRPLPWTLWAVLVGVATLIYFFARLVQRESGKTRWHKQASVILIALILPIGALLQLLPAGDLNTGVVPPELASPYITLNQANSSIAILRLFTYLGVFILTLEVCTRPSRVKQLMHWILFGATAHALLAMVLLRMLGDTGLFAEKAYYSGWATGAFINRNSFATYLGIGLVCGIALLQTPNTATSGPRRSVTLDPLSSKAFYNLVCCLCIGLILIVLLASGSRMGLAASLFAALFVALPMWRQATSGFAQWTVTGFVLLACLVAVVIFGNDFIDRVLIVDNDFGVRTNLYRQVYDLIWTRPLLGYGLDSFPLLYPLVHAAPVNSSFTYDLAHSTYLTLWVEMGLIVGSAPMVALLLVAVKLCFGKRNATGSVPGVRFAFATLVLCAVHSTVDFSLEKEANVLLFVIVMALGLSQVGAVTPLPTRRD